MRNRIETAVFDVLTVLLFGLPQGALLGSVWLLYSAWATLAMKRFIKG
jgi:hypothetical protein